MGFVKRITWGGLVRGAGCAGRSVGEAWTGAARPRIIVSRKCHDNVWHSIANRLGTRLESDVDKERAVSYESPGKKPLEDALAKMGKFVTPALRASIEKAIASIDHTDPQLVLAALPHDVVLFHRDTYVHALRLVPMIKAAHDSRCYIEAIVLSHGVIQLSLRGLFVMAWQRAVLPRGLEARDLEPYYKQGDRRGDVIALIKELERNELLFPEHAAFLREINATRNKAAHGVIFGEIQPEELEQLSTRTQNAAVGALKTFQAWFNNARPLKHAVFEYGQDGKKELNSAERRRT